MGKAITETLAALKKQFGGEVAFKLGSKDRLKVSVLPTGLLSLDEALGVGGVPRGRITEIFGPESGGKTTLALQIIAQAQKNGGQAAFIDAEHALDPKWAKVLGVNTDELVVSQPDYGEQALEVTEAFIRSGEMSIVVVDSVAALTPRAELEGQSGDSFMGLHARMMSQAMRKMVAVVSKSETILVFINQLREKLGVQFGNPETSPGGRALKFSASIRLDVRRISALKDGDRVFGNRTRIKVVKNKVAAPFAEAEVDLLFGHGYSTTADVIDMGLKSGILEKNGNWINEVGGEKIALGRANAIEVLAGDAARAVQLEQRIREKLGMGAGEA